MIDSFRPTMVAIVLIGTIGIAGGLGVTLERSRPPPRQAAMQHRVELLEEDVSRLEQRVVKLEDVLVEVLAVQTASPAKGAETKPAAVSTKPPGELPVSVAVPQDPSVQARPAKRKSVVRHPATQGSEYPLMKPPYPWTGWENPAPQQQ